MAESIHFDTNKQPSPEDTQRMLEYYNEWVGEKKKEHREELHPLTLRLLLKMDTLFESGRDCMMRPDELILFICRICGLSEWHTQIVGCKRYMVIPLTGSLHELRYSMPCGVDHLHMSMDNVEEVQQPTDPRPVEYMHVTSSGSQYMYATGSTADLQTDCQAACRKRFHEIREIKEGIPAVIDELRAQQRDLERKIINFQDQREHGIDDQNERDVATLLGLELDDQSPEIEREDQDGQPPEIEREDQNGQPLKKARTE